MSYNYEKNWFWYEGQCYGYGTVVKLKPEMYRGIKSIEEKCKGNMEFVDGMSSGYMVFKGVDQTNSMTRSVAIGGHWNPYDAIEYIVKPVYVSLQPVWKKAVENYSNAEPEHKHLAFTGTIWYILVMIIGTLFHGRLLIYIMATIVYWNYWVNKYRD
jgi:hypothetical protein